MRSLQLAICSKTCSTSMPTYQSTTSLANFKLLCAFLPVPFDQSLQMNGCIVHDWWDRAGSRKGLADWFRKSLSTITYHLNCMIFLTKRNLEKRQKKKINWGFLPTHLFNGICSVSMIVSLCFRHKNFRNRISVEEIIYCGIWNDKWRDGSRKCSADKYKEKSRQLEIGLKFFFSNRATSI